MLRLDLARELTTHCLVWWPQRGDRFVVPDRGMDRLARLERTADGWSVVLADGRRFADPDVESAYGKALLATV